MVHKITRHVLLASESPPRVMKAMHKCYKFARRHKHVWFVLWLCQFGRWKYPLLVILYGNYVDPKFIGRLSAVVQVLRKFMQTHIFRSRFTSLLSYIEIRIVWNFMLIILRRQFNFHATARFYEALEFGISTGYFLKRVMLAKSKSLLVQQFF